MAQEKEIHPRRSKVEQRINTARDSLPGERNDLPAGSLGGLPTDPQADETVPRHPMHRLSRNEVETRRLCQRRRSTTAAGGARYLDRDLSNNSRRPSFCE